ncbi:DNA damage-regulated autophagy modulator protein 1 isoform X2 [Chiloscyllium plagiosum]|uniref:DNA damage-regulated autophagy modulator protein 1 isoform X2 n=1 Tax=Chiloscyllium plagiosum TaxID=36176 RepID=UPI001CB7B2BC|nr:DNA damage-regulated autophagy modulator protein 1 isoform X2 [Chiloscyllium plagiosum]
MWWFQIGTCCLPVALVIWSCAAFVISFLIAVLSRHVPPLVPFISDTGTQPPERCIFGLMINFSAFLGLVVMYIRYKLLKTLNERTQIINLRLNTAALICGALGCLGMCIVANFQETALRIVHDIGALLAFVMGTVYLILQSYISFKMMPCHHTFLVCGFRIMLSTVSAVATVPMIVCYFLSNNSTLDLTPEDQGYGYHAASAVCEWLVAFSFNFFFLTYIKEFQIPYILRDSLQHLEDEVQQLSRLPLIVQ